LADFVWCDIWGDGSSFGWDTVPADGQCEGGDLCGGPSIDWRQRALNAERDRDLMQSFWNAALAHGHAAADGKPEPRGEFAGTDAELNLYAHVEEALASAFLDGAQHGLLAAAWVVERISDWSDAPPNSLPPEGFSQGVRYFRSATLALLHGHAVRRTLDATWQEADRDA
jgi:hypothetical protein